MRVPWLLLLGVFIGFPLAARADLGDAGPDVSSDIDDSEKPPESSDRTFAAVPIPLSNPSLGDGLVIGAAYFYPQTEVQAQEQPASMTAAALLATNNDSRAFGVVQQNFWMNDMWRFTGVVGGTDLRLALPTRDEATQASGIDWRITGSVLYSRLAHRLAGSWYGGAFTRVIDATQDLDSGAEARDFDTSTEITAVGAGLLIEYDTRDNPFNSAAGRHLEVEALFNEEAFGSDTTYQSLGARYRSYHRLADAVVLAWELRGCKRGGRIPLWDACTIALRGFSATDHLGKTSGSGQVEVRWQISRRWGLATFAGAGYVTKSFSDIRDNKPVPSYGAGLRYSVMESRRINLRVDYAQSLGSDAMHISVGEAF